MMRKGGRQKRRNRERKLKGIINAEKRMEKKKVRNGWT